MPTPSQLNKMLADVKSGKAGPGTDAYHQIKIAGKQAGEFGREAREATGDDK